MENKYVGQLLLGVSAVLVIIIFLFQGALMDIVELSCGLDHGDSCPMTSNIRKQTYLALSIVALLVIISFFLMFTKPDEKIIIKRIKVRKRKPDTSKLDSDERKVVSLLSKESGAMFQSTLMEKLEIGKVKTTRLLDKLESKQIIERKRRGMNNIVVLK